MRIAFDPVTSSVLAAGLVGQPELADELLAICRRESHCRFVRAHEADRWAGPRMYANAMRVGWLDSSCVFHRGAPARFSTRGVHGLSAAYSLRFLGSCVPPEALDVPLLSALAAARRAESQCSHHGACTSAARHRMWIGRRRSARTTRS
ncbi:MAG TPA: hypothetical protein VFG69_19775 [Nannocystaceae bacterium]|nr:hypothetical protein [Nannocystaceae bacterium]